MRRVLIGPLVVALAQTVSAGSLSNFDKPIKDEIRVKSPRFLDPCHVGGSVLELGRQAKVLVGFESTRDCWLTTPMPGGPDDAEVFASMTPRQAFDRLMTLMPEYSWKEMDGVAVVRPTQAWNDPNDPLNFRTSP